MMYTLQEKIVLKFKDRPDAARLLAKKLEAYKSRTDVVVMAILAGGVPVGHHLAKLLHVSFGIVPCKKINHPAKSGITIGSVTADTVSIHDDRDIPSDYMNHQIRQIQSDLKERYNLYMRKQNPIDLRGKTIILVDDRLKTGDTMLASLNSIKKKSPAKVIVAVPVASVSASYQILSEADDFVCIYKTENVEDTEKFYDDLPRVSDEELIKILSQK